MMLFEKYYPVCRQYGMTEDEFWHSNPRKINVYREAWRKNIEHENSMQHIFWGQYGMSALHTVMANILVPMFTKGHANQRYISEPVRLFKMTDEEIAEYKKEQTNMFVAWANSLKDNYESKSDK